MILGERSLLHRGASRISLMLANILAPLDSGVSQLTASLLAAVVLECGAQGFQELALDCQGSGTVQRESLASPIETPQPTSVNASLTPEPDRCTSQVFLWREFSRNSMLLF